MPLNTCKILYKLDYTMTKPPKKLSNQRSSIAKARKSKHTRQKSPFPWPSPTPHSNYSISAPSTPPASAISTPASHCISEINFGNLDILNQWPNDVSDSEDEEEGYHSDDLLSEMEGEDFAISLDLQMQNEVEFLRRLEKIEKEDLPTAFSELMKDQTARDWDKVEPKQSLGYNKQSRRKKQLNAKKTREKEVTDQKSRNSSVNVTQSTNNDTRLYFHYFRASAAQFQSFFKPAIPPDPAATPQIDTNGDPHCESELTPNKDSEMLFGGYELDIPDDEPVDVLESEIEGDTDEDIEAGQEGPPKKRQRHILEIPAQEACCQKMLSHRKELEHALKSIDAKITSQKTKWNGGKHGLEAMHA